MEEKILSATSDVRQRRQKVVKSDVSSEASGAGDRSDADDSSKSSVSVSATSSSWFYRMRFCIGIVVMLVCAWVNASYVKQLHETQLWFSNIQVRSMYCPYICTLRILMLFISLIVVFCT